VRLARGKNHRVKSLTEHLWFEVPSRRGYENITETVEGLVRKSGIQEGLCLVNAMQNVQLTVFALLASRNQKRRRSRFATVCRVIA